MLTITVLGATGGVGTHLVRQAIAAGHTVVALARSPDKMAVTDARVRVVQGDATDRLAVARALDGAQAVISVLDAPGPVIARATAAILAAARGPAAPRIVMMSSFAVVQDRLDPFSRFVTRLATRPKMDDKAEGEAALRASGLPHWVIVYATRLTNEAPRGVRVVPDSARVGLRDSTSRADAAHFLLEAATRDDYDGRSILITGN